MFNLEGFMTKEEIVRKVMAKILERSIVNKIPVLVSELKKMSPDKITGYLQNFATSYDIDEENFAKIVESLIKRYQVHTFSLEHKKELKKLTSTPPLRIYLKGLIY